MESPEQGAAIAAAVVEEMTRLHGEGVAGAEVRGGETVGAWRNIDIAWRKAEEAGELVS
jgi:kinesin family member C2/C3